MDACNCENPEVNFALINSLFVDNNYRLTGECIKEDPQAVWFTARDKRLEGKDAIVVRVEIPEDKVSGKSHFRVFDIESGREYERNYPLSVLLDWDQSICLNSSLKAVQDRGANYYEIVSKFVASGASDSIQTPKVSEKAIVLADWQAAVKDFVDLLIDCTKSGQLIWREKERRPSYYAYLDRSAKTGRLEIYSYEGDFHLWLGDDRILNYEKDLERLWLVVKNAVSGTCQSTISEKAIALVERLCECHERIRSTVTDVDRRIWLVLSYEDSNKVNWVSHISAKSDEEDE